ncbi:hypothetical protein V511_09490 [Mesotoga sp. Brook.08.YT.4.2.5.1]|uniref:glycosyltransferase family 4 protein n=1 Tax=unclassified Mesotoga TaxID=1184398 RepID=UPI000CAB1B03|nr:MULTISPECIES: glycosyltransferase family 4 protein [unclassified Mesotoga]PNE20247.1 hypothetical protein V511_09490 [Mesotoga sp. Brook.08.YT.4.2.5.1]RAO96609.1 hypothetical protein M388_13485 [Mesotoga sp. Brook.08.YT.4.2.5.4.]RDI93322.1 hypothetical protein Q502_06240 [Mesotoga sp. Brook.08.YT.4.2.5.2.]
MSVEKSRKAIYVASIFTHFRAFHIPFLRMLQEEGFEVWAAARTTNEADRKELEAIGIKCVEVPFSRSPYSVSNFKAYRMMRKLFRENHFELIHVHTPAAAFIARAAARGTGQGKVIYTAHGFHFYKGAPLKNWLIYCTAEKIARKWTDVLITINKEDFENGKKLDYKENRSLFLTHGVGVDIGRYQLPEEVRAATRTILGIDKESVVFICIGELNKNKNQKWLLEAWKEIDNEDCILLIVGDGRLRSELEAFTKNLEIKNVLYLGYREDIPELLSASDVLVSVSKREGLPKNVMEAMAAGKPVIGTNVRGTRDLVKHDESGLLVDLGNCEQLANALQMLSKSKDLREAYGLRARNLVEAYSVERAMEEIRGVYTASRS